MSFCSINQLFKLKCHCNRMTNVNIGSNLIMIGVSFNFFLSDYKLTVLLMLCISKLGN